MGSARAILPLLILSSLLVAGCVTDSPGAADADKAREALEQRGEPADKTEARSAMREAFASAGTDKDVKRFEARVTASRDGEDVAKLLFQDAADTLETFWSIEGLQNLMDDEDEEEDGGFSFPRADKIEMYMVGRVFVIHAAPNASAIYSEEMERKTGSVFNRDNGDAGTAPDPSSAFFSAFSEYDDFNVTRAERITYLGKPAIKLSFEHELDEGVMKGSAIVLLEPKRLVVLDATLPKDPEEPKEPDRMTYTFAYGEDVKLAVPDAAARAAKLARAPPDSGFLGGGSERETSGQFWGEGRAVVKTSDVDVIVRAKEGRGGFGQRESSVPPGYELRFRLSEGVGEDERVSFRFSDADEDGTVSKGDTYTFTVKDRKESASDYEIALYDRVTQTYVTPAPAAFLALAALGLVALMARRR